jgi:hypothetical protein
LILGKTETGQRVLKDRSVLLSPRQRAAFILFDGKRSVNEVLQAGTGIEREDVHHMIELGLLGLHLDSADDGEARGQPSPAAMAQPMAAMAAMAEAESAVRSPQQRYKDAYPIAAQLAGSLGLRGFRLNLQVEAASSYADLLALAPKIRAAVGPEKAAALDRALND